MRGTTWAARLREAAKHTGLEALRRVRREDQAALYWWRAARFSNAGDEVGPYLYRRIAGSEPRHRVPSNRSWRTVTLSAGSVLQFGREDSIIWGSGILSRTARLFRPHAVLAVRGPLSRQRMLEHGFDCPEVYGDPALLLPLFVDAGRTPPSGIGFVPHYVDLDRVRHWFGTSGEVRVIDVTAPLEAVLAEVSACQAIVASSLHGIIFAHAYGIPAARVHTLRPLGGDGVKFADYASSLGLEDRVEDGGGAAAIVAAAAQSVAPCPQAVSRLRQGLLETCPFPSSPGADGVGRGLAGTPGEAARD